MKFKQIIVFYHFEPNGEEQEKITRKLEKKLERLINSYNLGLEVSGTDFVKGKGNMYFLPKE